MKSKADSTIYIDNINYWNSYSWNKFLPLTIRKQEQLLYLQEYRISYTLVVRTYIYTKNKLFWSLYLQYIESSLRASYSSVHTHYCTTHYQAWVLLFVTYGLRKKKERNCNSVSRDCEQHR